MDWDLKSYFTAFGNPTYKAFKEDLKASLQELNDRAAQLLKGRQASVGAWETFLLDYEHMLANFTHLYSYISCLTASNAGNDDYQKEETRFAEFQADASKLSDKIMRGVGAMSGEVFDELISRDRLSDAAFKLKEFREESAQRMPAELEDLTADLGVNGISAWSRLYFTTMGNLSFRYEDPENGTTEVPMAQLNSLLSNPDRQRRVAASEGAAKTLEEHKHMYAAAINALSGTRHTLNSRRGIDNFLRPSLRQARIKRTTLYALMNAVEDRLPFARDVFRYRSGILGIENPGWVDLRAPLPMSDNGGPDWESGVGLISSAFNATYPSLGSFFDELISKKWVDYTPRKDKRPGGFCTGSLMTRESRIFMTYKDTLNDVLTLAHEAGHAWHSRVMKETRVLASQYPMTLAETASTLAERMFTEGVLRSDDIDDAVKLIILDAEIEHMLAFLLDLPIRFRFEEEVYERRKDGTLSPAELCDLMKSTQRRIFGDAMAEGGEDPWFWASKMHFYIGGVEFYNYPYTFGYLLSNAFMKQFKEEGAAALNAYERFLAQSGSLSCEEVVEETLGEDITDPNFWASMIDGLAEPFSQYQRLVEKFTT